MPTSEHPLAQAMLDVSSECFVAMAEILTVLGDDLANQRPELPGANSCYAIVNHCIGVVDYWAGSFIAGQRIPRDRDSEFTATGRVDELLTRLTALQQRFPGWVEVAVTEDQLERVIEAIQRSANSGKIGDGKIFVTPVERVVRIRTGELDESAI